MYVFQIIVLYLLNLHHVICQWYLNEAGNEALAALAKWPEKAESACELNPSLIDSKTCTYKHSVEELGELGLKTEAGKSEKRVYVLSLLAYWSVVLKILVLDLFWSTSRPAQYRWDTQWMIQKWGLDEKSGWG